ncbi:MAG TPA: CopD family protein [Gemmatimonadaceae bacterium]|nr:CopD family protein [Gemmatimonadaceae bacterium]
MPTFLAVAERTASLFGLVILIGAAVFRARVVQGLASTPDGSAERAAFVTRLGALTISAASSAGVLLLLLSALRLHLQVVGLFDTWTSAGTDGVRDLLLHSTWGRAWIFQTLASLAVVAGSATGRPLDTWMTGPLAIAAALTGHAAGAERMALTVGVTAVHVLTASAWVGGVFFVLAATMLATRAADLLAVVRGFNTVALTCAALVALTGAFAAWVHVGSWNALISTSYGTQLIVKVSLVAVTAAAGAWNWKRATTALERGSPAELRNGVAVELFFAIAVIMTTGRLVLLPLPSGP